MKDFKTECAEKLEALSSCITPREKQDAEKELSLSRPTIDKYLSGDIIKIDTATRLINFFSKKVNGKIYDLKKAGVA